MSSALAVSHDPIVYSERCIFLLLQEVMYWDMSDTSFMYAYLANAYKSGSLADVYVAPSNSLLYSEGRRVDLNYDPE